MLLAIVQTSLGVFIHDSLSNEAVFVTQLNMINQSSDYVRGSSKKSTNTTQRYKSRFNELLRLLPADGRF